MLIAPGLCTDELKQNQAVPASAPFPPSASSEQGRQIHSETQFATLRRFASGNAILLANARSLKRSARASRSEPSGATTSAEVSGLSSGAANAIAVEDGRDDADEVDTVLRNPFGTRTRALSSRAGRD